MANSKTLVCVHAHPDDEAIFTSGVTAKYSAMGYDVYLVTCTNGMLGIDDHGRDGSQPDHDDAVTKSTRAGELLRSAAMVGFRRVLSLGFDDSGMLGWAQNEAPNAFTNCDVDAVAKTVAAFFDEVGASVVLTYDENGFYGHPDHVMANTVTRRAVQLSASTERLYYPVVPRSVLEKFVPQAQEMSVYLPAWVLEAGAGTADELVTTTIDVVDFASLKQEAIRTHRSQTDNDDLVTMEAELFALMFGTEYYERAWSRGAATGDDTDIFGGL
jgi:LmbE family N-acetylglucosaminyl deacetylase